VRWIVARVLNNRQRLVQFHKEGETGAAEQ
jgi:hypothetical protein